MATAVLKKGARITGNGPQQARDRPEEAVRQGQEHPRAGRVPRPFVRIRAPRTVRVRHDPARARRRDPHEDEEEVTLSATESATTLDVPAEAGFRADVAGEVATITLSVPSSSTPRPRTPGRGLHAGGRGAARHGARRRAARRGPVVLGRARPRDVRAGRRRRRARSPGARRRCRRATPSAQIAAWQRAFDWTSRARIWSASRPCRATRSAPASSSRSAPTSASSPTTPAS